MGGRTDGPLVVDSWLASAAGARRCPLPEDHWRRFALSCAALVPALGTDELDGFAARVRSRLAGAGACWPRLEAFADGRLLLHVRPAPARRPTTRLWTLPGADLRTRPRHKGPDLAALAVARRAAQAHGADDAVLLDAAGHVLEAASGAIAWWEGEDLCLPASEQGLPSVTLTRAVAAAGAAGVAVRRRDRAPSALAGRAVWYLNALHGISPVVSWTGSAGSSVPGDLGVADGAGPRAVREALGCASC